MVNVPARWTIPEEEIYYFRSDPRDVGATVLLTVDATSYNGASLSTRCSFFFPSGLPNAAESSALLLYHPSLDTGGVSTGSYDMGSPHPIGLSPSFGFIPPHSLLTPSACSPSQPGIKTQPQPSMFPLRRVQVAHFLPVSATQTRLGRSVPFPHFFLVRCSSACPACSTVGPHLSRTRYEGIGLVARGRNDARFRLDSQDRNRVEHDELFVLGCFSVSRTPLLTS